MDSFAAFEEVLYLAKRFRCDLVLLGGDLFHENRPSRRTIYKTMQIMRRYCMGPGAVRVRVTSDPRLTMKAGVVNYLDPHYSIDLPIFSIHGNHDDPTRDGGDLLAALDLLSMSNMVNYFGMYSTGRVSMCHFISWDCFAAQKETSTTSILLLINNNNNNLSLTRCILHTGCQEQVDDVRLYPVMLEKGTTQIGLYGLGSMRDERLNRMWREGKVKFFRYKTNSNDDDDEEEEEENPDDGVFHMFVLHQNRDVGRGTKNCVQETLIPEFCDLVVWGHEHECQIEFAESLVGTFRITQPGSSVATSLVAGEAVRKKVGILDVKGKNFRMHTVPLTQVRSFVMSDVSLSQRMPNTDSSENKFTEKVTKVLEEQVNMILLDAKDDRQAILAEARAAGSNAGDEDSPLVNKLQQPEKVLVRLRVEHTESNKVSNHRFGAKFVDEIANPDNILLFRREKVAKAMESKAARKARESLKEPVDPDEIERTDMGDLVNTILELPGSEMKLLGRKTLGEALEEYVEKNNLTSIPDAAGQQLEKRQKILISNKEFTGKEEDVKEVFQEETKVEDDFMMDDSVNVSTVSKSASKASSSKSRAKKEVLSSEEEDENMENSRAPASRKSSTKKAAKPRTASGRRKQKLPESDDDEVVVVDDPPTAHKSRSRRSTKKIDYSMDVGDSDQDDEEEAVVDLMDASDDDDDEIEEMPKSRKTTRGGKSKAATKSASRRKPAATKTTGRKKRALPDSDDDDDFDNHNLSSVGLDADWGSAATRSQL